MGRGRSPGEFEQVVLLTLAGFEGEARGGEIYDALVAQTSREVSVAAVYITLARMQEKRWVHLRTQAPAANRGGRPRKFFALSVDGAALLNALRAEYDRLWARAAGHPHIASGGRSE